jgi:hypothetical protein
MNTIFISKSTQDFREWLKTTVISFIPVGFFMMDFRHENVNFFLLLLTALWIMIIITGISFTPYKYVLGETHLTVKRLFGDIKIPLEEIMEIRLFTEKDRKGFFKPFGAEGVFGIWGLFRSHIHKRLYVYARRDSNWTLVVTPKKKYVIAPDDVRLAYAIQKMLKALHEPDSVKKLMMTQICRRDNIALTVKSMPDTGTWIKTVAVVFMPVVFFIIMGVIHENIRFFMLIAIELCLIIIIAVISHNSYSYVLDETHLIIVRHYGNIEIPLDEIREIRLFTEEDRKGIIRKQGIEGIFGNFGLYRTKVHEKLHFYTGRDTNWTLVSVSQEMSVDIPKAGRFPARQRSYILQKKYVIAPNDVSFIDAVQKQIMKIK